MANQNPTHKNMRLVDHERAKVSRMFEIDRKYREMGSDDIEDCSLKQLFNSYVGTSLVRELISYTSLFRFDYKLCL